MGGLRHRLTEFGFDLRRRVRTGITASPDCCASLETNSLASLPEFGQNRGSARSAGDLRNRPPARPRPSPRHRRRLFDPRPRISSATAVGIGPSTGGAGRSWTTGAPPERRIAPRRTTSWSTPTAASRSAVSASMPSSVSHTTILFAESAQPRHRRCPSRSSAQAASDQQPRQERATGKRLRSFIAPS